MTYEIWNSNEVKPPLSATFKAKAPDIDVSNVVSLLFNGIDTHSRLDILRLESCIMRKVIYRLKLQFRHDKGFKFFEATNRALNKYLRFDIAKDMKYFVDYFPRKYEKVINLPSKQMLEYLLVRLQGYAQICARIVDTSFNCTNYMKTRLILGHQWEIAVVVIAIASRICFVCRHLSLKCCLLYNNLLPLLDQLEITGQKWLPDSYEFPNDLTTWLSYDWLIEKPDIIVELPVGLPKFSLIDDDDVEFTGQYRLNNTIIIPDSDDEEDTPDVKFVCNLSSKNIRLNKKQAKYLQSRLIINVDDSDSDDDRLVPSSNFDDILELFDDDVQIINSPKNNESDDIVEVNDTFEMQNMNDDFIEYESDVEQVDEADIEIIEDDQDEDEDIGEPFKRIEENDISRQENEDFEEKIENVPDEVDGDVGEPITRKNVQEISDEEEISDTDDLLNDIEDILAECNEEENEFNEENQLQEENIEEKRCSLLAELKEVENPIKINGEFYKFDTIEKLESLLDHENFLRKTGKSRRCLFINVYDPYWYRIAFYIKYFIAMTLDNIQNRNKYIIKAKNLLAEIARDVNEPSTNIPYSENDTVDTAEPMTLKGKEYLINSIDSLSDIQVLLFKEVHEQNKNRHRKPKLKFLFSHLNLIEWKEICLKIKCYVVIGIQKPIKSNIFLKKSKAKLRLLLKENYCVDTDSSDGSDVEELKQDKNIEQIYSSVTKNDIFLDLYKYIQHIEENVHPPKMSRKLKIRMRQNTRKSHLDGLVSGEYDEGSPNKKRKITPQTPTKLRKNSNSPKGKNLVKSQEKKKLQKKENEEDRLSKSTEEKENENLQLDIVQNNNTETEIIQIIEKPKISQRTAKREAPFNKVLFSESYYVPTIHRKQRARQRRYALSMKKLAEKNHPPTSALSKNENNKHWRNPVTHPHIKSKEELAEIKHEEDKKKKREEYLKEQRVKLDELWKLEEDEITRLEKAEYKYEVTAEEREKRMKWLEEEIDKIDETWTLDEQDIHEIEQIIEQRRQNPARYVPQPLRRNIDPPPRVEVNARNIPHLSKKQRERLNQEAALERERKQEFERRQAQEAESVRRLKLEQAESKTSTQTTNIKTESTSEVFELAPPLVTIKKEDPDRKPIIRPNPPKPKTSNNKKKEKKLSPRERNQLQHNAMEKERMMRIQREEEYARRIYEEEEYRRAYEERVYAEQYRGAYEERLYEERMRQQYASVPHHAPCRGPYNSNYRGSYESHGRAYEGNYRRPPAYSYGAYY